MKNILEITSNELLREYFFEVIGNYPSENMTRETIIRLILQAK